MSHSLPNLDAGRFVTDEEGAAIEASHVLKKYEDEFFRVTNAKLKLLELKRKEVISDDLVMKIKSADEEEAQDLLFEHLHRHANVAKLREYCRIAISADGYPKMQDLGEKMLRNLPPEGAGLTCGQASSQAEVGAGQICGQASSQAGGQDPETTVIPDIVDEYVEIKKMFVSVCRRKGSPTLEEVKEICIDLIRCVFKHIPRITRQEDDIEKAKTFTELARIVCFHLSKWVSYEFFKKVVTHFQPALRSVKQRLMRYEDKLKPLVLQKLEHIAELQRREEVPRTMAELVVKYRLDANGFRVRDLIAERDFLAERLNIPEQLLQVLSWGEGSIVVTYWILRDLLPLAELALCREDVQAELTRHGVEEIYLGSHPSGHFGPVDQPLQTLHMQRRTIVTVLNAHRQDLDVTSLTSDLKYMGVLTAEQCQKLASLDDKEKRHEALLYTLLAHNGPDTFHKLVECMALRDSSTAADLQTTFKCLVESPGALSIISSSQCTPESPVERVVSRVVEAMSGELSPQQTGQGEPTRGVAQPHLKEESSAGELEEGEPRQDKALEEQWAAAARSRRMSMSMDRPMRMSMSMPGSMPSPMMDRPMPMSMSMPGSMPPPMPSSSPPEGLGARLGRWLRDMLRAWAWAMLRAWAWLRAARAVDPEEPEVIGDPEEPEVTGDPEEPEVTEDPEEPEVTEDPEEPEVTEDPEEPEVTEDPEEPEVTEDPEEPEVTEDPEEPEVTENPEEPEVTEDPEEPEVAEDPNEPEVTGDPEEPEVTED